jgi:hypothetical protein
MTNRPLLSGDVAGADEIQRDVMTVLADPTPTYDPVNNLPDRKAAAGVARLQSAVAELKEDVRDISQKVLTTSARNLTRFGVGALAVAEFVGVRASLERSSFAEPALSTVSLVVVTASLGAASWIASDAAASLSKRALRIGFIGLLIGGVAGLRFSDVASSDEGITAFDIGPALLLVAATLAPVLFGELLLRRLIEDEANRKVLASRVAELKDAEQELVVHERHIDDRFKAMDEHKAKVARLAARLRLQKAAGASAAEIAKNVISRRRGH